MKNILEAFLLQISLLTFFVHYQVQYCIASKKIHKCFTELDNTSVPSKHDFNRSSSNTPINPGLRTAILFRFGLVNILWTSDEYTRQEFSAFFIQKMYNTF